MGRVIVRVPPGWVHPRDDAGEEIDGGHHEPLYDLPEHEKSVFQIYQDVSEGSPVSPVFATLGDLKAWLIAQGYTADAADTFVDWGFAPSAVVSAGGVADGIQGLDTAVRKKRWPWFRARKG